ncbi:FAD-dependent oxidoreductase [Halalkalibacillus halophilus]|uniref:FAD-dependent oxidoreductase n=1 Tax=Halalkalibacillus halophilus TaxID=392827 RepID=UPI0003FB1EFD|nr:NAD(P)/FAD-dependent oxidoreductase [Halalkalibacillus halophilus]
MKTEVLISGGGVGGLTLAVLLVQHEINVTVVEQMPKDSPIYKGELLQPKTLEILEHVGVIDQVLESGHKLPDLSFHELDRDYEFLNKHAKAKMDYTVLPTQSNFALMIPHERLKEILLEEAYKYDAFFTYKKPTRFLRFENGKAVVKQGKDEYNIEAQYYVGAEGRASPTRDGIEATFDPSYYNHHFLTVTIPRPAPLTQGRIITTDQEFLGLFPLPDEVRTVFKIKKDTYKSFKEKGIEYFHERFSNLAPDLKSYVETLKDYSKIQLMIPYQYHIDRYVQNNVAVLGDAAHTVHPMAGEGMNMAIQDADILGMLLGWMKQTKQFNQTNLLKHYEDVRRKRSQFLLQLSNLSAHAYSYQGAFIQKNRARAVKRMELDPFIHYKQVLNVSGLGMKPFTYKDRLIQIGGLPTRKATLSQAQRECPLFNRTEDYPWEEN